VSKAIEALPPLREVLSDHGLMADKRFGQHFLLDLNLTRKIARLAAPLGDAVVIEVGPGPGGLTRALLAEGCARLIAIERDPRFVPLLEDVAAAAGGRLTLVQADALKIDEAALAAEYGAGLRPLVVANLPYNAATPLLVRWLTGPFRPALMALMFQKEVAMRIAAAPGADAYGRLSVLAQATCEARLALTLPARAFTPPPKVDSAVVVLIPRADAPSADHLARLERVTAAAFGQRRKMLRSSLKSLGGEALCRAAEVDPDARAETIDVAGFLRIAHKLSE
jgi:16S rRNA (adenine1518-N6/adenine1519-N6)-dimethyltransferase